MFVIPSLEDVRRSKPQHLNPAPLTQQSDTHSHRHTHTHVHTHIVKPSNMIVDLCKQPTSATFSVCYYAQIQAGIRKYSAPLPLLVFSSLPPWHFQTAIIVWLSLCPGTEREILPVCSRLTSASLHVCVIVIVTGDVVIIAGVVNHVVNLIRTWFHFCERFHD